MKIHYILKMKLLMILEYIIYKHKLNLFYDKIKSIINNSKNIENDISNYIIYFLLCELRGERIEYNIYSRYNKYVNKYFDSLHENFFSIIYTYILRYDLDYNDNFEYLDIINDNILIPNNELQYYKNTTYKYLLTEDGHTDS